MNSGSTETQQWVQDVLERFAALDSADGGAFGGDHEWPPWVWNLHLQLLPVSYPGIRFKSPKTWTTKDLGRLLGRHYAWGRLLAGEIPLSSQVNQELAESAQRLDELLKQRNLTTAFKSLREQADAALKSRTRASTTLVQEILASACELPYEEARAFFGAFARAVVIGTPGSRLGVGEEIVWTMLRKWKQIEAMESIGALHRMLQAVPSSKGINLTLKRVEKLCQRIKLKFKGPGRPRGKKTQTNPKTA